MAARPSTARGQASYQRIIDVACDLFYRQGIAATGLSEIMARSGTAKGQLYFYFADKEAIVEAVVIAQVEHALQAENDYLTAMSSLDDLIAWGQHAVQQHQDGSLVRCPLGSLVSQVAGTSDTLRLTLDQGFQRWRAAIAEGLRRLQNAGVVRADRHADELAELVLCAYEGGVLMSEVHDSTASLELALTCVVEFLTTPARDA